MTGLNLKHKRHRKLDVNVDVIRGVARGLSANHTLTWLSLEGCDVRCDVATMRAEPVMVNTTLEGLILRRRSRFK
jgi:hypothetical protein